MSQQTHLARMVELCGGEGTSGGAIRPTTELIGWLEGKLLARGVVVPFVSFDQTLQAETVLAAAKKAKLWEEK